MRVLVTGAAGFLGRHVVRALRASNHTVRAMVRPSTDVSGLRWGNEIEITEADLSTSDLAPAIADIDVVLHLAAKLAGETGSPSGETITGTTRLLDAIARGLARRLVLASSFSVYDWSRVNSRVMEDSALESPERVQERDGYTIAKVEQENLCRRWATETGKELIILRPGAIWGRDHLNLPHLGQKLGPVRLVFTPGALRLTYVENCAQAFVKAAEAPSAAVGRAFNVVDNDAITAMQYARSLGAARIPVPYGIAKLAPALAGGIHRVILRGKGRLPSILTPRQFEARFKHAEHPNDAARSVLGWSPRYSFDEAWKRATHD
jgi:UDP-glucose 4-epimerase